jgi:hypothetical protein
MTRISKLLAAAVASSLGAVPAMAEEAQDFQSSAAALSRPAGYTAEPATVRNGTADHAYVPQDFLSSAAALSHESSSKPVTGTLKDGTHDRIYVPQDFLSAVKSANRQAN